MCKNSIRKFAACCAVILCCVSAASCSLSSIVGPDTESTTTTKTTTTKHVVETTKTAMVIGDVDGDDEGMDGYTTTTTITGGTLENDYSAPDEYDNDIRATMTTKATTYYTLPNGKTTTTKADGKSTKKTTTTEVTTTKFKADALNSPTSDMLVKGTKYTVASDTTYLNLRFGPSKKYSVQLEIPNGVSVTATAETKESDGTAWAYINYNGTSGWVMKSLLA